jgi:hypothetical protein
MFMWKYILRMAERQPKKRAIKLKPSKPKRGR